MMSSLVFLLSCCFLLSLVRADDFWWADKVDKDKETRHKHGKFVIKDDTGNILKKVNVKGYLLNEVKIEKSNVKILVLAVDMLPKDNPQYAMSASNAPNSSECIIRREEAQHNPYPHIIPECDENGDYSDRQCFYNNPEMCQCWNKKGTSISGDFKKIVNCKCYLERASAEAKHVIGVFVPQCEDDGTYKSKQCWGSTGMCWCVNPSGEKISQPTRYGVNCHF